MKLNFVTVDVFTSRPFGGNPLAVVPDARSLTTGQMQTIARDSRIPVEVLDDRRRVSDGKPAAAMGEAIDQKVPSSLDLRRLDLADDTVFLEAGLACGAAGSNVCVKKQ